MAYDLDTLTPDCTTPSPLGFRSGGRTGEGVSSFPVLPRLQRLSLRGPTPQSVLSTSGGKQEGKGTVTTGVDAPGGVVSVSTGGCHEAYLVRTRTLGWSDMTMMG